MRMHAGTDKQQHTRRPMSTDLSKASDDCIAGLSIVKQGAAVHIHWCRQWRWRYVLIGSTLPMQAKNPLHMLASVQNV